MAKSRRRPDPALQRVLDALGRGPLRFAYPYFVAADGEQLRPREVLRAVVAGRGTLTSVSHGTHADVVVTLPLGARPPRRFFDGEGMVKVGGGDVEV